MKKKGGEERPRVRPSSSSSSSAGQEKETEEKEGREFLGRKEGKGGGGGGGKKRRARRREEKSRISRYPRGGMHERQKAELTFLHPLPGVRRYNVVNSTFSRAGGSSTVTGRPAPSTLSPLTRLYAGKQSCGNPIDPTGHIRPVTFPLTRSTPFSSV